MANDLIDFQNSFTKEQKASILRCLMVISKAKPNNHPVEMKYLEDTLEILGIDTDDPIVNRILIDDQKHEMLRHLKTLNKGQKDWFVVSIHGMLNSFIEGSPPEKAVNYVFGVCGEIDITPEMYMAIIKKTEAIQNKFYKK